MGVGLIPSLVVQLRTSLGLSRIIDPFFSLKSEIPVLKECPFRFLAGWIKHLGFLDFVKNKWSFNGNVMESLSHFTSDIRTWNKTMYGHIGDRKKFLVNHLTVNQSALERSNSERLKGMELYVRDELESILHHEELLWKRKSRCDWLNIIIIVTTYIQKYRKCWCRDLNSNI